jgi:hypothetical protein
MGHQVFYGPTATLDELFEVLRASLDELFEVLRASLDQLFQRALSKLNCSK